MLVIQRSFRLSTKNKYEGEEMKHLKAIKLLKKQIVTKKQNEKIL